MTFVHTLITLLASQSVWRAPLRPHCQHTLPIARDEFHQRHTALLTVLRNLNASAYIAEPGPNTAYYANFSSSEWQLSERPFVLLITPQDPGPKSITLLTPKVWQYLQPR